MPDIKLIMPITGYVACINTLRNQSGEVSESRSKLLYMLSSTAFIINESRDDIQDLKVSVKIDRDALSDVFDEFYRERVSMDEITENDCVKSIVSDWVEKMDAAEKDRQEKEKFDAWLTDCFDRCVKDADTSCKEVTDFINSNESGSGYTPVKFQNIMRQLKSYKKEKFG